MSVANASKALNRSGRYLRKPAFYRKWVSDAEGAEFPAEAGRYHLYASLACPWATRCLAVRALKRLETTISVSIVHPTWQKTKPHDSEDAHIGWMFTKPSDKPVTPVCGQGSIPCTDTVPDTVNGAKFVRDLYDLVGASEKVTRSVPILWDKQTNRIVNNESSEIIRMLNGPFARLVGSDKDTVDLYPAHLRDEIDAVNEWVYRDINSGVYKAGFAKTQGAYEAGVDALFLALDRVDEILSKRRYLAGSGQVTKADVRLFMTLIRFDSVYAVYFKCNARPLTSYPHIHHYFRELYQLPWLQKTTNLDHITRHYYTSHPSFNTFGIIPRGPNVIDDLLKPHSKLFVSTRV